MSDADAVSDAAGGTAYRDVARAATRRLAVLTGFVGLADFVFGAVYVDVLLQAGLSPGAIGVGFFTAFALSTLVEVPSGGWGDRWGQRRLAMIGLACWGTALIVFAIAENLPVVLLISLVAWSVGQALFSGAPISLTINEISPAMRDLRLRAVRSANVAKWAGSAIGGLAVLAGVVAFDARVLIGIAGAILVLLAVWVRLRWPEAKDSELRETEQGLWQRLRAGWTPALGPLLAMAMLTSMLLSVVLFAWQPLIASTMGIPISANGAVLFVMTVIAAVGAWLTRFRSLLGDARWDTGLAVSVTALLILLAGASPGVITTIVALAVAELLTSYGLTALAMDAHGMFEDRYRNMLWSVFSASMGVSMAVTDLIFGLVWDASGLPSALVGAGSIGLILVAITTSAQQLVACARRIRGSSGPNHGENREA